MSDTFLFEQRIYGSTPAEWALAAGLVAVIVLGALLAKSLLVRRLSVLAARTRTQLDDALVRMLGATQIGLIALASLPVGAGALELAPRAGKIMQDAATVALFLQAGLWASVLLEFALQRSWRKANGANTAAAHSLSALGVLARVLLWAIVILLMLDNLGVNISALIAGLGIGGIAVALAVQNILGDLFASLSIVIDKPFVTGDFIIVDSLMGTVEHVGLKSTRLRSLDGEQIVMSNSDLLKTRIRNYKRMHERRALFRLRLACNTPPEQLEAVAPMIRRVVESQARARFERAHFAAIGESSLDFETVYWITDPDYNLYMDIQQAINLALMRGLARLGVELAFPVRPEPVALPAVRAVTRR